jgi:hypothetical protein
MRQNDRSCLVGQGLGGGEQSLEIGLFPARHGQRLAAPLP